MGERINSELLYPWNEFIKALFDEHPVSKKIFEGGQLSLFNVSRRFVYFFDYIIGPPCYNIMLGYF